MISFQAFIEDSEDEDRRYHSDGDQTSVVAGKGIKHRTQEEVVQNRDNQDRRVRAKTMKDHNVLSSLQAAARETMTSEFIKQNRDWSTARQMPHVVIGELSVTTEERTNLAKKLITFNGSNNFHLIEERHGEAPYDIQEYGEYGWEVVESDEVQLQYLTARIQRHHIMTTVQPRRNNEAVKELPNCPAAATIIRH